MMQKIKKYCLYESFNEILCMYVFCIGFIRYPTQTFKRDKMFWGFFSTRDKTQMCLCLHVHLLLYMSINSLSEIIDKKHNNHWVLALRITWKCPSETVRNWRGVGGVIAIDCMLYVFPWLFFNEPIFSLVHVGNSQNE